MEPTGDVAAGIDSPGIIADTFDPAHATVDGKARGDHE